MSNTAELRIKQQHLERAREVRIHLYHPEEPEYREFRSKEDAQKAIEDDPLWRDTPYSDKERQDALDAIEDAKDEAPKRGDFATNKAYKAALAEYEADHADEAEPADGPPQRKDFATAREYNLALKDWEAKKEEQE